MKKLLHPVLSAAIPGLLFFFLFQSCDRGKAVVTLPVSTASMPDSVHFSGADELSVCGRELFRCLRGEKNSAYLKHFLPDSGAVALMFQLTHSKPGTLHEVDSLTRSGANLLLNNFKQTREGGLMVNVDWSKATLDKMMTQDIEDDPMHGKNLYIYGSQGDIKFKISCRCLLLGNKWFIGDGISFLKY